MGIENLVQLTIVMIVAFAVHLIEFRNISKCSSNYNIISLTDITSLFVICLSMWMFDTRLDNLSKYTFTIGCVVAVLTTPVAFFFLIKTIIREPKCIPQYMQKIDLSILGFLTSLELIMICVLTCIIYSQRKDQQRK